jgi:hypothetical protein
MKRFPAAASVLSLVVFSAFAHAESGFYPGRETGRGSEVVNGVPVTPVSSVSCALNAREDDLEKQRRIDYVRSNETDKIEALHFKAADIGIVDGQWLSVGLSTLLLRCDRGGRQEGAQYHWEGFLPEETEALAVLSSGAIKNKTFFASYERRNDPLAGARGELVINVSKYLRSSSRRALDRGEKVVVELRAYHAFKKATRKRYDTSSSVRHLFTGYSTMKPHMVFTITLVKDASGDLRIVRQ